jgi:putative sterol carrier protein
MDLGPLDPRRLLNGAADLIGQVAPDDLATRFAQVVRQIPPERLDQLMTTPVRRVVLDGIFAQMPRHLDRQRATGVNASIRWKITGRSDGGADIYDLVIAEGRGRVKRGGEALPPRLTITVDAAEFIRVAAGSSNPVNAYFSGKLALRGDVMQAARLTMLFRIPSPNRRPPPADRPPADRPV